MLAKLVLSSCKTVVPHPTQRDGFVWPDGVVDDASIYRAPCERRSLGVRHNQCSAGGRGRTDSNAMPVSHGEFTCSVISSYSRCSFSTAASCSLLPSLNQHVG